MTDLRIDEATLRDVSARITACARDVSLDEASHWDEDAVGSADVAAALRDAAIQQRARARVTAASLTALAAAPATAADEFHAADAQLMKAF